MQPHFKLELQTLLAEAEAQLESDELEIMTEGGYGKEALALEGIPPLPDTLRGRLLEMIKRCDWE